MKPKKPLKHSIGAWCGQIWSAYPPTGNRGGAAAISGAKRTGDIVKLHSIAVAAAIIFGKVRTKQFGLRSFHYTIAVPVPSKSPLPDLYAAEIAKRASGKTKVLDGALHRVVVRAAQKSLFTDKDRRCNITNNYTASPSVRGKNILLVDDVATSGATLSEAIRALRAAGAAYIQPVTIYAFCGRSVIIEKPDC